MTSASAAAGVLGRASEGEGEGEEASTSGADHARLLDPSELPPADATLHSRLFWGFGRWLHTDYLQQRNEGLDALQGLGPRPACLVASNHSSHLDCSAIFVACWAAGVDRVYALGARDYFFTGSPFRRWFVQTFMNVVPISRRGIKDREVEALKHLLRGRGDGRRVAVVIFPEGTRSATGRLQPFKSGVGLLAAKLGVPVVPACVHGTRQSLPKSKVVPVPSQVVVRFGEPLAPPELAGEEGAAKKARLRAFRDELRGRVAGLQEGIEADHRPQPGEPLAALLGGHLAQRTVLALLLALLTVTWHYFAKAWTRAAASVRKRVVA